MGGASRDRGAVVAGVLVAELGRVTVVHHPDPPAIARRLARRPRAQVLTDSADAARLADELEAAAAVRALGAADGDPASLAAALASEDADRSILAERDALRSAPPPPADPDEALARLDALAAAVRHARAAEQQARARLDAAAAAAGAAAPSPLCRVDPDVARAAAHEVAPAAERARRIQERLNLAHADSGQDWSVVTAQHRYALAKGRFARRIAVAAAVLCVGMAASAPLAGTVERLAPVVAGALALVLALRALRRLRAARAQLENALFWAGLSHPDRLASRNLDAQMAAVDISELRRAEGVLAEALRRWEALAGPGADPADCEALLAEAARHHEAGLPEAHDTWVAACEVAASADLAWRAALAELGLPVVDAAEAETATAALRARAEAASRRAEVDRAAEAAEARIAARAVLRRAAASRPTGEDPAAWLAALGAAPPPSLVALIDGDGIEPDVPLTRTLERIAGHAPVAVVTDSVRRWSGVINVDLDLRRDDVEAAPAPERAWFASS